MANLDISTEHVYPNFETGWLPLETFVKPKKLCFCQVPGALSKRFSNCSRELHLLS